MDLRRYGYLPGHYYNKCLNCNVEFVGAKGSTSCEPCATAFCQSRKPRSSPLVGDHSKLALSSESMARRQSPSEGSS